MLLLKIKLHPRLFITDARLNILKKKLDSDHILSNYIHAFLKAAEQDINLDPIDFVITGPRMLKRCQTILKRLADFSLAFLLTNDYKFADRAKKELLNAADFPHWNPEHFLDTAELCTAFAIGYDWLYYHLSDAERMVIKKALVEKGLKSGLAAYEENAWWVSVHHNWNIVCNGGLAIGALALTDEIELCETVLKNAIKNIPFALKTFEPDGGWEAGPEYWEYTTQYCTLLFDAMETAKTAELDVEKGTGFKKTGLFPLYCAGPTDQYFNFADSEKHHGAKPLYFWLGQKYGLNACINENHRLLQKKAANGLAPGAFDLIWYQPPYEQKEPGPRSMCFKGIQLVFMRNRWNDPNTGFVGFKGGYNQADHAHLDLGSFVYDANGSRWAEDLGRDDYDLPDYWNMREGGGRWQDFRMNNWSHNTLVVNNDVQRANARAKVIKKSFSDAKSFAIIDLTEAYLPHANSVRRGFMLLEDNTVVVQDEIEWKSKGKLAQWQLMTSAKITINGPEALLYKNGKEIYVKILAPETAGFTIQSAHQKAPQAGNEGYSQLIFDHHEKGTRTTICVVLSSYPKTIRIIPLLEW